MAKPNGRSERLYRLIAAAPSGITRDSLCQALSWESKPVDSAVSHLIHRGLITRVARLTWKVTEVKANFGASTPLSFGSDRSGANARRRAETIAAIEARQHPEPKITRDVAPRPTAAWQLQPSQPPLGFSKLPLGATLDGHRV